MASLSSPPPYIMDGSGQGMCAWFSSPSSHYNEVVSFLPFQGCIIVLIALFTLAIIVGRSMWCGVRLWFASKRLPRIIVAYHLFTISSIGGIIRLFTLQTFPTQVILLLDSLPIFLSFIGFSMIILEGKILLADTMACKPKLMFLYVLACDLAVTLFWITANEVRMRFLPLMCLITLLVVCSLLWVHQDSGTITSKRKGEIAIKATKVLFTTEVSYLVYLVLLNCAVILEEFADLPYLCILALIVLGRFVSVMLALETLNCFVVLTEAPIPSVVDSQWVSGMLQEKGILCHTNSVVKIHGGQLLTGGCHSAVCKMELEFETQNELLPEAIIVKILSWKRSFLSKCILEVRSWSPYLLTKDVSYIASYTIESKFYEQVGPQVRGIILPRVYFNYRDSFNHNFGMVMEDITFRLDNEPAAITGQPLGFSFSHTQQILSQLARFHASFWERSCLSSFDVWNVAGYYTGTKRSIFKDKVRTHWDSVLQSCEDIFPSREFQLFGERLYQNRERLQALYHPSNSRTLVHGDYKISNIFIDERKNDMIISSKDRESSVVVIDWQWVGLGVGAIDVAYFMATSTQLSMLNEMIMKKLVMLYYTVLVAEGVNNYSFEEFWRDFRLSFIDFVVYVICCKWNAMDSSHFLKNQAECKDGLHIRLASHAVQLVRLSVAFMDSLHFPLSSISIS